jgi:hypothetical protein
MHGYDMVFAVTTEFVRFCTSYTDIAIIAGIAIALVANAELSTTKQTQISLTEPEQITVTEIEHTV